MTCEECGQPFPYHFGQRFCSIRCRQRQYRRFNSALDPNDNRTERYRLLEANLLHLLDLKRAGHSPRRTELKIKSRFTGNNR